MPLEIRNVTVGMGRSKIIAPIMGRSRAMILMEAQDIVRSGADICEWRVDRYADANDFEAVYETATALRGALRNMPLLITCRTKNEGGALAIEPDDYAGLLRALCGIRVADMLDVEMCMPGAEEIIEYARDRGVITVVSNHDISATPPEEEILRRLTRMADMGADIAKVAVTPHSPDDVLTLMRATTRAAGMLPCPLITMAMGKLGVISRIAGEIFGSACTFGSVGLASAPGQLPVDKLKEILNMLRG